MREFVDEPVVGIIEMRRLALGNCVDLLLRQPGIQPQPDMRGPFELRGPVTRRAEDRDLGLLRRVGRTEADMRAQAMGKVGKSRAVQPDMHRRRHRAARTGLAIVPDAALLGVQLGFVLLFVARHGVLSGVGSY
jgi:hypothetical protein